MIGNKKRAMLGNHGVLVMADTVAEAFDDLYYLERACQTLVLAYSTGQKLKVLSHEIAEATARGWEDYKDAAFSHFDELKSDPRRQGSLVQGLIADPSAAGLRGRRTAVRVARSAARSPSALAEVRSRTEVAREIGQLEAAPPPA